MSVTNKPQIELFLGGTGSGKGVSINRRLAEIKPKRLIIWDPRNEYGKHAALCESPSIMAGQIIHARGGPVRVRLVPGADMDLKQAFGIVCKLAFHAKNCVFLAEELSDVTTPSWAPPAWKQVITQGRHNGLHVLGAAQRPALIDKSALSAATVVRGFMMGYDEDNKVMAKELRAKMADVEALITTEDEATGVTTIRYLERIRRTRELVSGQIVISATSCREQRKVLGAEPVAKKASGRRAT